MQSSGRSFSLSFRTLARMEPLERGAPIPDPLTPYLEVDRSRPRHECWVTGHMVAGLDGTACHPRARRRSVDGTRSGPVPADAADRRCRHGRRADGAQRRLRADAAVRVPPESQRRTRGQSEMPPVAVDQPQPRPRLVVTGLRRRLPNTRAPSSSRARKADPASGWRPPSRRPRSSSPARSGSNRPPALQALAGLGHRAVLCEGGPTVARGARGRRPPRRAVPVDLTDDGRRPAAGQRGALRERASQQFALKSTMVADDTVFLRYEATPAAEGGP
jgi:riboflavin biosynthesis pyrimidine reductase